MQVADSRPGMTAACDSALLRNSRCRDTPDGRLSAWASADSVITPEGSLFDGTQTYKGGPCTMNCTNSLSVFSGHTGGCNFLFGDGSVHFISQAITWPALAPLMTVNEGEVIDASWL